MNKVGVLISGNGSTLQALLDSRDHLDIQIVISSGEKAYGLIRAKRAGVKILYVPHELRGKENKERAESWILEALKNHNVEKIFLCGYMKIVSTHFISHYQGKIFNVHPSLLPKYKGLNSLEDALQSKDATAGVTIHHVVEDVDSGEYVIQREFDIPEHRDTKLTHLWLHIQEQRLLREAVRRI